MSGIWGPQTALDLYLQENGITSLLFAGVNADQVIPLARFAVSAHADSPTLVRPRNHRRLVLSGIRCCRPQRLYRDYLADRWPGKRLVQ